MINSYTYSFHIAEYKLSAYPEESDLLSWSIHRSEGDKKVSKVLCNLSQNFQINWFPLSDTILWVLHENRLS
jgi:hypothetical protein